MGLVNKEHGTFSHGDVAGINVMEMLVITRDTSLNSGYLNKKGRKELSAPYCIAGLIVTLLLTIWQPAGRSRRENASGFFSSQFLLCSRYVLLVHSILTLF